MEFNIWNLAYLLLMSLSLGIVLAKHGKPREDEYNFWVSLLSFAMWFFLLYKGGFFNLC